MGALAGFAGFVLGENLALPLVEHREQGFDAGAEAGDLAGVEADGAGELFFGELAALAVHEHVLEGGRDEIGRRLRRAREAGRVVPLVGVDDAAEGVAIGHCLAESRGSRA